MSNHSFQIDNLRMYIETVDGKTNQLGQLLYTLSHEVSKLRKTVTKLKNGEDPDDEEEETVKTAPTNPMAPAQNPMAPPQAPSQFNQMPQLQTLNLTSGSTAINN